MAEFVDVLKQLRRLHMSCEDGTCKLPNGEYCPIYNEEGMDISCDDRLRNAFLSTGDTKHFENIVMEWAKNNPEPRYPTWADYFVSQGILIEGWENANNPAWIITRLKAALKKHIPADTAEKLGLEPVNKE